MTLIKFLPLDLGSALLAGLFQVLFDRLIPHSLPHLIVPENEVLSELKKWFAKLEVFQAALDDAEEKQWKNMAVKKWLDDLRDFAYDLEDMLDEHNTEILKRSLIEKGQKNLISIVIEELNHLLENFSKKSKSRAMTQRLEELCERRSLLGLIEKAAGAGETSTLVWQRPPSTCLPTEPSIHGRDEDKSNILEMMSRDESSGGANFRVISIVGMAGVGKTTLAKQVYNDITGVKDFNLKVWICVSSDFDVFRISKAILESITHATCDLKDLNEVQVQLRYAVVGRRFLLVLDDVWSKNYDLWITLKSPFVTGAKGSRIIVTTRCIDVALTVGGPCYYYNLKLLSDDHCWSVFQMHAFENRTIDELPNLESVREKVVQKCGGLPLAARTLGGLLRSKQRDDEWEDILTSRIWDLSPEDSNILPVLKLSYHHLPSHLKRCFAYCAIFPKNYEFEEKELVLLWMAEGLILPSANHKQLEDLGSEYFHDFLSRSIFQQSSGNASKFVMHNLFNELAQWVSGETNFRLEDEHGANEQFRGFQRARHSSYTIGQYDGKSKFEAFDEVIDHLRTFLPILTHNLDCYISDAVILNRLPKFKRLRVLSLQKYHITKLPDSIGELRYLRYINLADTKIVSLPNSVTDLLNLQILILRNCSLLLELPPKLGTLNNLRHLDIEGVPSLCHMPLEMQALKYLQTLSNFVLGKNCGSSLNDLKNLKLLRGGLHISKLENVADSQELIGAILSDKKLEVLILEWGHVDNSRNKDNEKDVIDMLQPHTNLTKLTIKCYGGSVFPSWVEDSAFSNMVVLRLEGCENCTSLPSLGVLSNLKELMIIRMTQLTRIDSKFYGSCSKPFQSLEILLLEDLQEWSHWEPIGDNADDNVFGQLRELSIVKCPKLSERLPAHLPSLQKLVIQKCAELVVSILSAPMLCELEVDECREMVYTNTSDSLSLNSVSLSNITEFRSWFSGAFQKVEKLIIKFPLLDIVPHRPFLFSLVSLEIKDCSALTSLKEVMEQSGCLNCLAIEGCDSLTSVAIGRLPSSLKRLEIRSCGDLKYLLDGRDQDGRTSSSSASSQVQENTSQINASLLEYLYVSQCPALESLSSTGQLPEALQHLEINNCSMLATLGQLPETVKRLEIKTCRKLNSLSSSGQLLASLEYLSINECPITTLSLTAHFPASLQHLIIDSCSQLESLSSHQLPSPLKYLKINDCKSLSSIADSLQNLSCLREIHIFKCPSLKNFPQDSLPNSNLTILSIPNCENFVALPSSMHTLNSLQELHISNLRSLPSFLEQGFPMNLTSLYITSPQFYDRVMERLHKLHSLKKLRISGCQDAKSFPREKSRKIMLPTSLTSLTLEGFGKLGSLSPKGFRNLTILECLSVSKCPELTSFPKKGLPSTLLELHISHCSSLKDYCMRDIKRDQSNLAHIPYVTIDGKSIHDQRQQS